MKLTVKQLRNIIAEEATSPKFFGGAENPRIKSEDQLAEEHVLMWEDVYQRLTDLKKLLHNISVFESSNRMDQKGADDIMDLILMTRKAVDQKQREIDVSITKMKKKS